MMTKKEEHETWFEDDYLKPLGLHNKRIQTYDFEGLIRDSKDKELTIFELKCIGLAKIKKELIGREFKSTNHGRLILYPEADKIRRRIRDDISEAKLQVLKKEPSSLLPRIIFLILDTPDSYPAYGVRAVRDVIKGMQVVIFPDLISTFQNERSDNQEALDPFYDGKLSGIVCIERKGGCHVTILENKRAQSHIPKEFLIEAQIEEV